MTDSTTSSTGNSSTMVVLMVLNLVAVLAVIAILLNRQSEPGLNRNVGSNETIIIDRVGNFAIDDGRVNMDLISLQNGAPKTQQKLSMPQQGFLKCYADMGQMMKLMIERGLIEATANNPEDGPAIDSGQ